MKKKKKNIQTIAYNCLIKEKKKYSYGNVDDVSHVSHDSTVRVKKSYS